MRNATKLLLVLSILIIVSCKKDKVEYPIDQATENYSSLADFHLRNEGQIQDFIVDAVAGGSFTTPQGTVVSIPTNAFVTQANQPVTGNVTVQFRDIYKKSDMLLSGMPTMLIWGPALKSGGEFFIQVHSGTDVLDLAPGKKILIEQPIQNTGLLDTLMTAFTMSNDSLNPGWQPNPADSIYFSVTSYVYSLSSLSTANWFNTDDPSFFSAYTQTQLILQVMNIDSVSSAETFLVFQDISSVTSIYHNGDGIYPYNYAPVGLQCTAVVLGIKNGVLYSAFVPISITANQLVSCTLSPTTASNFKAQLETLD